MSGQSIWEAELPCRSNPDLFFPEKGKSDDGNAAKALCVGCPASDQCLELSNKVRVEQGVWAGLTDRKRRKYAPRRTPTLAVADKRMVYLDAKGWTNAEIGREFNLSEAHIELLLRRHREKVSA